VTPLAPKLSGAGPQLPLVNILGDISTFFENVGTIFVDAALETRGAGAIADQSKQGFGSLSVVSALNASSILGLGINTPYLLDRSAMTLDHVFTLHTPLH